MRDIDIIIETSDGNLVQSVSSGAAIFILLFIAAIYITFYVLRSIGIYKLAKGQGVENAFMAWIPCVWMFTACKIIGKSRIFGYSAEKLALLFTVIFTAAAVIPLVYNFLTYFPYIAYYLEGGQLSIVNGLPQGSSDMVNHFDTQAINTICKILAVFNYILSIAEIFITVTVYIALFRKFWPEHYILAAVLSFFGLFPIFAFAIRNKNAVDFNEYIRRRYYGSGYTPYGNRYYGGNGQNNGNERGTPYYGSPSDDNNDPFGEFSNRPEEPFGEFSDNKRDGDNNDGNDNPN